MPVGGVPRGQRIGAAKRMASAGRIKAGVIGLGSMGLGMAQSLVKRGIDVARHDLDRAATDKLAASGGRAAKSAADALADADVALIVVVNAAQAESTLFGSEAAASAMKPGGVIVASPPMPPADRRGRAHR